MEKSSVNEVVSTLDAVKSNGQPGFWILLSILIVLVLVCRPSALVGQNELIA